MNNSTATMNFNRSQPVPAAHVTKGPNLVKYNARSKYPYFRLPFVGGWKDKSVEAQHWALPASGGYFGGYQTGEAMAHAFLKYLREDRGGDGATSHLTSIVESLMIRFEEEGGQAMNRRRNRDHRTASFNSFRGQYVGFFNTIAVWLAASAKQIDGQLDAMDEAGITQRANEGLRFDECAYMAEVARMDR